MATFFDYLNAINNKTDVEGDLNKDYNPWMVNRGLSLTEDTVYWANEMNRHYHLDKDMQFAFLYSAVSKRKRFPKWPKKDKVDDLAPIMEWFNVSPRRAAEYASILQDDQIELIREKLKTGGRK